MPKALVESKTRTAYPIFAIGNQARSPFISTVDRLNAMVEMSENGKEQFAIVGMPGLSRYAQFGESPARGIFVREGSLSFFIAAGNQVVLVSPYGQSVVANLETDSGPVWMDDSGVELFINDGETAFIYTHATGVTTTVTNINYPAKARGAVFLQGRFWVYVVSGVNAGRVFASDQYNGNGWDAVNFITPAARPGGIVAVTIQGDDLVIIGNKTIEWWSGAPTSIAGALGFQPSAPASTEVGGSAERGFTKVGQKFFFIGHTNGQAGLYEMQGYRVVPVQNIKAELDISRLFASSAICSGYTITGHEFVNITVPGSIGLQAASWSFDAISGQWSQMSSIGRPFYRALLSVSTLGGAYVTDAFTGTLYKVDEQKFDEDGEPMEFEVTSRHILNDGDHITIHGIQIDVETGVGAATGQGADPHAILSVSKDHGKTWIMERHPTLGRVGEYKRRAIEYRFGTARDFAVKFRITDPVARRVTGAFLIAEQAYA